MTVEAFPIPQETGIAIEKGGSAPLFFHGLAAEAQGGEVHLRFRIGADGLSFYPVHLQDGETWANEPFAEGLTVPDDLWVEVTNGEFLVAGAIFARVQGG